MCLLFKKLLCFGVVLGAHIELSIGHAAEAPGAVCLQRYAHFARANEGSASSAVPRETSVVIAEVRQLMASGAPEAQVIAFLQNYADESLAYFQALPQAELARRMNALVQSWLNQRGYLPGMDDSRPPIRSLEQLIAGFARGNGDDHLGNVWANSSAPLQSSWPTPNDSGSLEFFLEGIDSDLPNLNKIALLETIRRLVRDGRWEYFESQAAREAYTTWRQNPNAANSLRRLDSQQFLFSP